MIHIKTTNAEIETLLDKGFMFASQYCIVALEGFLFTIQIIRTES